MYPKHILQEWGLIVAAFRGLGIDHGINLNLEGELSHYLHMYFISLLSFPQCPCPAGIAPIADHTQLELTVVYNAGVCLIAQSQFLEAESLLTKATERSISFIYLL